MSLPQPQEAPATPETPDAPSPPRPANDTAPERIDWPAIARALALGRNEEHVALDHGVQPRIIRRHLKRTPKLRRLIGYFRAELENEAAARVDGLRGQVAERLSAMLAAGNPRVTLWLADRLKLTEAETLSRLPGAAEADLARRAAKRAHIKAAQKQYERISAEDEAVLRDSKGLAGASAGPSGASGAL